MCQCLQPLSSHAGIRAWCVLAFSFWFTAIGLSAADDAPPAGAVPLKGHTEAVYAVAFTPDGRHVVTGSFDHTLKVWETATGKEIQTLGGSPGHQSLVLSVAVSPDGKLIASGSSDNTARIWEFPVATPLRRWTVAEDSSGLAISPDGKTIAVVAKNGTLTTWAALEGKALQTLAGSASVTPTWTANGQYLIAAGTDGTVRFRTADGKPAASFGAHASPITALAVDPGNKSYFTAGEDGLVKIWSLPPIASRPMAVAHEGPVTALALSADNNTIVSGSTDKTVRLTALANGQAVRTLTGASAAVAAVAVDATNAYVASGAADGRLFLWNLMDGKLLAQPQAATGPLAAVAFHPKTSQLLTGGADGLLKLWGLPIAPAQTLLHTEAVTAAAISSDRNRLFTGSADKLVRCWNVAAPQQPERQFSGHSGPVTAIATSNDGKLLASAAEDGFIRFWDQSNGRQVAIIGAHAGTITSLSFQPSGNHLLSSSTDGSLKVWQAQPAEAKLFAHPDQVTSAALSADGTKLVTGCTDKQVRLWNLDGGQVERAFPGNTLAVLSVAARGNLVAAGGADKSLTIWNVADGKEVNKFAALPAAVQSVALSPDGKLVAAGLSDNSLRLFDLAMGKEVKNLVGHTGPVTALLFPANSDRLISASADKTVQVWNVVDGMSKWKLDAGAPADCLALSTDGARVAAGCRDKAIRVWTLADGKAAAVPIATPAGVTGVGFSLDGGRLIAAGTDGKARIYSSDGQLQEFFSHDGPVVAAAFLPDGKRIVSASADKTARAWTPALVWRSSRPGAVRQAVFTPGGDQVVSGGDDNAVSRWSAADGKLLKSSPAEDSVASVAVSADGKSIVAAGADKKLKIYKAGAEESPQTISLPAAATAVAVSPNGTRVAVALAAPAPGQIHVFDVATGRPLLTLAEHTAPVSNLAFLADNRTLVSASLDKTVRLADVAVVASIPAHAGGFSALAIRPDGSQAATAGADKFVRIRDLGTSKIVREFGPLADAITGIDWSRDGTWIAAATGKSARVWNVADGTEVAILAHAADVNGVSFGADRQRLATACADQRARVWDIATKRELQSFGHAGPVTAVAFHGNNSNLVTASADKTVAVQAIQLAHVVAVPGKTRALAVTPEGSHLVVAADDGKLTIIAAGNGTIERSIDSGKPALAVAVSKAPGIVAVAAADGVRLFNFADGKPLATLGVSAGVLRLAFSPNGKTLAAVCGGNIVQTWNVAVTAGQPPPADFGKAIATLAHAAAVADLAWMPDSTGLWSLSRDKIVSAWKFPAETPIKTLPHPSLVDAVAFSPDGKTLATGCHDGHVRLYDVGKSTLMRDIKAHTLPQQEPIYCLAWSPDGKRIVSAGLDRSLKLWDTEKGDLVREFKSYKEKDFAKGHRDGVFCVAFSPDGKLLASGSSDRSLKLWQVDNGSVTLELANPAFKADTAAGYPLAHPGWIYGVRFTPDGKYLISAGGAPHNRGYLATWSLPDGKLISAEELAGGTIFGLALAPDGKSLAAGTAGRQPGQEPNVSFLLPLPIGLK